MNHYHSPKFSLRFSAGLRTPRAAALSRKFQALKASMQPVAVSRPTSDDFWTPGLLDQLHPPLTRHRD